MDDSEDLNREPPPRESASQRETLDEGPVDARLRRGLERLVVGSIPLADSGARQPGPLDSLLARARAALDTGDTAQAKRLMVEAAESNAAIAFSGEWLRLRDVTAWPDAWLVAAIRLEPPDVAALDVLVSRYWKALFARCQLLTLNGQEANDLAQEAWLRLLRARRSLKPEGNFPAYVTTIATNLWRDWNRATRRTGPLAGRGLAAPGLASLDSVLPSDEGDARVLGDVLPDVRALEAAEQADLARDLDQALAQLSPRLREVLVARFLDGESCADIGRRHGRTEQTISAWVRQAIQEMQRQLGASPHGRARKDES